MLFLKRTCKCFFSSIGVDRPGPGTLNVISILMKSIEAEFILHPEENKKTTSHAHGKTENIDKRITLVFSDSSHRDLKSVPEHHEPPID